jgi:hypothetical protein
MTHLPGFLSAALQKKGLSATPAAICGAVTAPPLWLINWFRGHCLKAPITSDVHIDVVEAHNIGDEFNEFWDRQRTESNRLLAARSREVLRQRFDGGGRSHAPLLVRAWRDSRLAGYAILVRADSRAIALKRLRIADLVADRDDTETVQQLLSTSYYKARELRIHMLEAVGYPEHIRQVMERGTPFKLKNEAWPYLYKTHDPMLRAALVSPDSWYPTLLDGDGC